MLNLHLLECTLKGYDHISDLLLAKYWVITGCKYFFCLSLNSINIPKSITLIGDEVFDGFSSLQSINVDSDNPSYTSNDGILFNKDLSSIIRMPTKKIIMEYQIPKSVTSIKSTAFSDCISLQKINIPNNVTYIGKQAFHSCSSLQNIDIPDSVITIEYMAFGLCKSLQTIRFCHKEIEKCKIADNIFEGIDFDKCTLYIPSGTRWSYRHHPAFSKFKNIVTERQA